MEAVFEKQLKINGTSLTAYVFHKSLFVDEETPVGMFHRLLPFSEFILESAERDKRIGRFSFIGGMAAATFIANGENLNVTFEDKTLKKLTADPLNDLEKMLELRKAELLCDYDSELLRGYFAGFCGLLSYDCIEYFEPKTASRKPRASFPYAYFVLPQFIIRFDHFLQKADVFLTSFGRTIKKAEEKANLNYVLLQKKLKEVSVRRSTELADLRPQGFSRPQSSFKRTEFITAVKKAKEYIFAGDIFQVVLSQRFSYPLFLDELSLYRFLRLTNPSPYMYFFKGPGFTLVGASPEPMIRVFDRTVIQRPIAGTRRRGKDSAEDESLKQDLMSDKKELAEHAMLVDLARNDIGRVSEGGSVKLDERMTIESYSHVMHIVSQVSGQLTKNETCLSALRASFPAGTVSGAPKVRALQIIDELEPVRRGAYSGAFGYVNFKGDLDTCLLIRTALCVGNRAYVQAGAGIVADSEPEKEYEETLNKASGLMLVLEKGVDAVAMRNR